MGAPPDGLCTLVAQWMMRNDFEAVAGRKFQFRAEPQPKSKGIVDCPRSGCICTRSLR